MPTDPEPVPQIPPSPPGDDPWSCLAVVAILLSSVGGCVVGADAGSEMPSATGTVVFLCGLVGALLGGGIVYGIIRALFRPRG